MNTILKRVLIILGVALVISVAFCSPCVPQQSVTPQEHTGCDGSCALPAQPVTKLVTQENWEFTLPGVDWVERESPAPDIKVAIMSTSPTNQALIFFIKEETDVTFTDYVIGTIRSFAMLDFKINSVKQVVVNDNKFILVQVSKNNTVIWSWLTVKDNSGYAFTCGSEINVDAGSLQHDLCQSIAQTVQIQ